MEPQVFVPREVLSKPCAANFFSSIWCVDATWAESKYRELAMIGFDVVVAHDRHDHQHDDEAPQEEKRPYALVGNVAVVGVDGPLTKGRTSLSAFMGGTSSVAVRNALRQAANDPAVKSILMRISSPGGAVDGIGDLGVDMRAIRDTKPIIAFAEDIMGSGGYWIGSQASHIMSSPHARIGSIGAYMQITDDAVAKEKAGVKIHTIRSTPKKGVGSPPIREEDITVLQKMVDETHEGFVEAVASGRNVSFEEAAKWGTGETWTAKKALKMGLVDSLGTIDQALALAQKAAGENGLAAFARRHTGGAMVAEHATLGEKPLEVVLPGNVVVSTTDAPQVDATARQLNITLASKTSPTDSGKLLKGLDASSEQATAEEPRPEEPDMTTGTGASPAGAGAEQTPPASPPAAPKIDAAPAQPTVDVGKLKAELMQELKAELRAEAMTKDVQAARERVAVAFPHMTAASLDRLVREPGDADQLIESLRGARTSTPLKEAVRAIEQEGLPDVATEVAKLRMAKAGGR